MRSYANPQILLRGCSPSAEETGCGLHLSGQIDEAKISALAIGSSHCPPARDDIDPGRCCARKAAISLCRRARGNRAKTWLCGGDAAGTLEALARSGDEGCGWPHLDIWRGVRRDE